MNIDPKFIDYDFPSDPNYVQGYEGKQPELKKMLASYADVAHVYNEATLVETAKRIESEGGGTERLVTRIFDQQQEGSCVGNGSCQAFEITQAIQFGRERVVPISPMSLYKRIGRSAQSGAVVSDAWEEINAKGVLPLDTDENKKRFKHTHPATGFGKQLPSGWEETAKMFRGLEATICDNEAEVLSALADGWSVVVGRQGHCICYVSYFLKDGKLFVLYVNSWGSWGQAAGHMPHGFGVDTPSQIRQASDWAFAIRSVTAPEFQEK